MPLRSLRNATCAPYPSRRDAVLKLSNAILRLDLNEKDFTMMTSPVISADELSGLGAIRLLYVPTGDEGVDGAVSVPIPSWIEHAKRSRSGLDDVAYWTDEIEKLGVGPDALTVVLDDGRMTEAARVWFILQYFGLPVAVLNGGAGTLGAVPPQAPAGSESVRLQPNSGRVGLKNRDGLKAELADVQVFDARTSAEYRGEDLKGGPRGGHLPGAANLAHGDLLDGTRLKSAVEIASLLDAAGIDGDKPIVTHCHGGGRAALAALAAVAAGREDVHVYYLSFSDWAADESCPLQAP